MRKVEATSDVFNLIDLFSDTKAKDAINKSVAGEVHINYSSHYL